MLQFSTTLRNNRLGQVGTTLGASGTLKVYTGNPSGVGNSPTGTLLSTQTAVTYGAASGGQVTITTTADSSAAATGTPGYFHLLTSGGTVHTEGTAGVGTGATAGTVTLNTGAITNVALGTGGTNYPATTPILCVVTGGGGNGALVVANVSGGSVTSFSVLFGGFNYATSPTIIVPLPFDLTFNSTISLNGNVSLSSATLTEGNV